MDDRETPADRWVTLSEASARTGISREALRLRVRRGKLAAQRGNDGTVRVNARDLADLPPPIVRPDPPDNPDDHPSSPGLLATTTDLLARTMDDLGQARTALEKALVDRLDDHGRAERAEARAAAAEARLIAAELALIEAQTPWAIRLLRAFRGKS